MLNLAGPSYDLGDVLFVVLQECEHRRRAFEPDEAEEGLMETARRKLEEVRESYEECGGTPPYWQELEREVLETAMPQYVPAAIEQTRLEKNSYDLWRKGDPAARASYTLLGLVIGALIIAIPFIPIVEDAFAFILAVIGLLYPEIKKGFFDLRQSKLLNRLIAQAERYQHDSRLHYMSNARLEEELRTAGIGEVSSAKPSVQRKAVHEGPDLPPPIPHPSSKGKAG
ncbi:MAG TPA: hypothetical protein VMW27_00870 [Thermoanaerobaculia bacterium]|nr:hypothetical protein [Thermoanaerobaculia bacterium]